MNPPNFDNALHVLENMLSKFDAQIGRIIKKSITDESKQYQDLDMLEEVLNNVLLKHDVDLQINKDKQCIHADLENCINKLKCVAEIGLNKQKILFAEEEELKTKLNILDKAFLLKHFTASILIEEDDHIIGVILNRADGNAETIRIPLDDNCSSTEVLLNHLHRLYNMPSK